MTTTIDLIERATLSAPARVDHANGIIYGVKMLGLRSANTVGGKRVRYTVEALRKALPHYEGTRAFIGHPPKENLAAERKYPELLGVFRNVRVESDGLRGDLHANPRHAVFPQLAHDAEHAPHLVGFSHNARGTGAPEGDDYVVGSISGVESVDLVTQPATTRGMFESVDPAAAHAFDHRLARLCEAAGVPDYFRGLDVVRQTVADRDDAGAARFLATLREQIAKGSSTVAATVAPSTGSTITTREEFLASFAPQRHPLVTLIERHRTGYDQFGSSLPLHS